MTTAPDDVVWTLPGSARTRTSLLVLPHAGGNAHAYAEWRAYLPDHVRLLIGQYPGRGARFSDPLPQGIDDLVTSVVQCLPADTTDLVVLGHSMGSLVAFEVARSLTAQGRPPRAFVASACRAPFLPNPSRVGPAALSDDELVAVIKSRGGTDDGILDEPELREIVLPSIRADFAIDDDYRFTGALPALGCPVHAIGGDGDTVVPAEALARWSELTDRGAALTVLPGGHFYFQSQMDAFMPLVTAVIESRHEFA
ncbi:MAG: alpha/beta fold hydrolase [Streptosporangiaceae bacterium]